MSAPACLNGLIGLSADPQDCFTDTEPEGYNESASGYFVVDTDYGVPVAACPVGGWGILTSARNAALRDLATDLPAALRDHWKAATLPWRGSVGKREGSGLTIPSQSRIGHRYTVRQKRGVYLNLKAAHLALSVTGSYTLTIESTDPDFVPITKTVTVGTAGAFTKTTFEAVVSLPLWADMVEDVDNKLRYFITVNRSAAMPIANTFWCCNNAPNYTQYFYPEGLVASDSDGTNGSISANAQGLALEGYLSCDELGWLCQLDELGGYNVKDVLARTLQFRAGAVAIAALTNTLAVTPCTLYNLEALTARRNWLNTRYRENLQWLAQNVPAGITDCFTCLDSDTIFHAKLIS